jgi:peptidoglycan-associated lipoprotein
MYICTHILHKELPMQEARRLALVAVPVLAALVAACASPTAPTGTAAGGDTAAGPAAATQPAGSGGSTGAVAGGAVASSTVPTVQARPAAPMAPTDASVYFGFDEYVLDADDSTVVERWGRHLVALPAAALRIEGHTDERGSAEYNLSLGQRRAQAVADALRAYGVAAGRLEAVSYGKERPRAAGRDEAAWAQNRRADLRATGR